MKPFDVEEAIRLRLSGMTYQAVGDVFDLSAKAVYNRLMRTGRVPTIRKSNKRVTRWPDQVIRDAHRRCVQGEDRDAVAAEHGVTYEALRAAWTKRGLPALTTPKRWSAKVLRTAYERYRTGEKKEAIAKSLGVSWPHLYRALHRAGYSTRAFGFAARRHDDIGRRAYSMRMQGKRFDEIAQVLGLKTKDPAASAANEVYRYCRRYKIQKPDRFIATRTPSRHEP